MIIPYLLVASLLLLQVDSANVGEQIGTFFNNLGKDVEQWAVNLSDDVRDMAMNYDDLATRRSSENQAAIEAYKRGEINDEQLRTRIYINNYEYEQAMNDRLRQQIINRK